VQRRPRENQHSSFHSQSAVLFLMELTGVYGHNAAGPAQPILSSPGSCKILERQRRCCLTEVRCCCRSCSRWVCLLASSVAAYVMLCLPLGLGIHFGQYAGIFYMHHCNTKSWSSAFSFQTTRPASRPFQGRNVTVPLGAVNSENATPVLYFGGQIESLSGETFQIVSLLSEISAYNASFTFQASHSVYRGYPPNHGWTSQGALTDDAMDLLDAVLQNLSTHYGRRVLVVGTSMGAGVAVQLAAHRPENVMGLLVSSPWSSLRTQTLFIKLPVSLLLWPWLWLSDRFDSDAAVASLPADIPFAVLSSTADHLIPPWEHRKLFDASASSRKWFLAVDAAHAENAKMARAKAPELVDFLDAAHTFAGVPEARSGESRSLLEVPVPDAPSVVCWNSFN